MYLSLVARLGGRIHARRSGWRISSVEKKRHVIRTCDTTIHLSYTTQSTNNVTNVFWRLRMSSENHPHLVQLLEYHGFSRIRDRLCEEKNLQTTQIWPAGRKWTPNPVLSRHGRQKRVPSQACPKPYVLQNVRPHVTGSEAHDHLQQDPQIYYLIISIRTCAAIGYAILWCVFDDTYHDIGNWIIASIQSRKCTGVWAMLQRGVRSLLSR